MGVSILRWWLVAAAACAPAPDPAVPGPVPQPSMALGRVSPSWSAPELEQRMVGHFAVATDGVWYLAVDDLGTMRAVVAPLGQVTSEELPKKLHPLLDDMTTAADAWARAPDRPSAARRSAEVAARCAACHQEAQGLTELTDDDVHVPELLPEGRHAVAPYLLWLGLLLPSDKAWLHGADLLVPPPSTPETKAHSEAFASRAARAKTVDAPGRAEVWTELIGSCATCHIASGIHLGGRDRTPR